MATLNTGWETHCPECYLIVAGQEGKLLGLQKLRLGDVQAILSVQELHHAAIAVAYRQVVLDNKPLQVLDDAPVRRL